MTAKFGVRRRMPRRAVRAAAIALLAVALSGQLLTATATAATPTPPPVADAAPWTTPAPTVAPPTTAVPTSAPSTKVPSTKAPGKQAPKKLSTKTTAACGGALSWYAVTSCVTIDENEKHTYTLPATVAHDRILLRLTATGEARIDGRLTGPDGSECLVGADYEPVECDVAVAGAYTLTVESTYLSGAYELSVASVRSSSCTQLDVADLSAESPGRAGDLPGDVVADCYQFSAVSGDVLQIGRGVWISAIYDASGNEVCKSRYDETSCTMSGPGPYRVFVLMTSSGGTSYTLRLARLTGDTGCPTLAVAPFGAPGNAVATGDLPSNATGCRSVGLSAGPHSLRLYPGAVFGSYVRAAVYDEAGQRICDDPQQICTVPVAGTHTIVLTNTGSAIDYKLSVIDLGDSRGCASEVGTSWDLPLLEKTRSSVVQLDCQPIQARAGDRILVRSPSRVYGDIASTMVVDGHGAATCPTVLEVDGCVVDGIGPFRVLSAIDQSAEPNEYQLEIGRLSNPIGCSPVVLSKFGSPAPTSPDGSRCRQLTVDTPGTYVVDPVGSLEVLGLFGEDGLRVCEQGTRCELKAAGKYNLVASTAQPVAIFPLTSTNGCVTQGTDTSKAVSGTALPAGQYDCLTLASAVGAAVIITEPAAPTQTNGFVLDALGNQICYWDSQGAWPCKLTGTGPFRAIFGDNPYTNAAPYRLTIARIDSAGCQILPQGDFTIPGGVTAALSPDRFTACYTIPAGSHSAGEVVQLARTGATGQAKLKVVDSEGVTPCHIDATSGSFDGCVFTAGKSYTVFLTGDATTAGFRLTRRDVSSAAKGCAAITSTTIGATAASGTLPDNSTLRCYRVIGVAADRFLINTRDAHGSVRALAYGATGQTVCGTAREGRCDATGSAAYQVVVYNDATLGVPGAYTLEAPRIVKDGVPAAECVRASSAYGVGPLTGDLTTAKNTACVVFPLGRYESMQGYVVNQVANGPLPYLVTSWGGFPMCQDYGSGDGAFQCNNMTDATQTQMLLVSLPEQQQISTLKYRLSTTCAQPLCGGAVFGVTSVTPTTGVVGTTVSVTLKGTALHPRDVVRLTVAGKPAITGTMRSVSADRTTSIYAFNLAGAALGVRDVSVTSFAGASVTLAKAFTVLGAAPKATKAPALSGTPQVNHTMTVSTGTWSPTCTSYTYQWYSGGVAVAGATKSTLALTSARASRSLYAAVTCARTGYASGRAVSNSVTVRA
ncbi:hypothetical protein [Kribbella sp. NPDC006257]|uniref:hypothetical protein n=1 Tax=Kribbella sp. NPDC006257 TaxID=3156738 RepID=UPI0033BEC321